MQCPECQAEVGETDTKCAACGASVARRTSDSEKPGARPRRLVVVLVALGVVLLIGGGVAAALAWHGAKDEPPPADSGSQTSGAGEATSGPGGTGGSAEASPTDGAGADTSATESPDVEPTPDSGDNGTGEQPAPLGYPTAAEAVLATLEANGLGEYVYSPKSENADLAVFWAGPPASEYVYEIVVARNNDGSWSVISMTNIWTDYEIP